MATNKSQEAIDQVWGKYRKSLASLVDTLAENEQLRKDLAIDFTMPKDIEEAEKRIEALLKKNAP
jgi:hypothetical protein